MRHKGMARSEKHYYYGQRLMDPVGGAYSTPHMLNVYSTEGYTIDLGVFSRAMHPGPLRQRRGPSRRLLIPGSCV